MVDKRQIEAIVSKNFEIIGNWDIDDLGVINAYLHVKLIQRMSRMPVRFGIVGGNFSCNDCGLTTLWGSPHMVGDTYDCRENLNTDLEYAPEYANILQCGGDNLNSLNGLIPGIDFVVIRYHEHLPLLRLLEHKDVTLYTEPHGELKEPVQSIMEKYVGQGKKAALACAAELIKAGYKDNARW